MKRKLLTLMCATSLILGLCSCTKTNNNTTETTNTTAESTVSEATTVSQNTTSSQQTEFNSYQNDCFSENNNRIAYEDDTFYSAAGIDVSSYSGEIDWNQVKNDGIEFAIIRIGGRGYGESGNIYADENAIQNITGAKAAGIEVGAYFFSQAITEEEAKQEAEFILNQLNGTKLELPVAYDFEFIENDTARTDNISGEEMTLLAKAFCDTIEKAGYSPIIYGESPDFYKMYNLTELKDIPLWYAEYSKTPDFDYNFSIWQYSDKGNVAGINGNVDMNIMFRKKEGK